MDNKNEEERRNMTTPKNYYANEHGFTKLWDLMI